MALDRVGIVEGCAIAEPGSSTDLNDVAQQIAYFDSTFEEAMALTRQARDYLAHQKQADFDRLFGDAIVATYTRHLGNYNGETLQVLGYRSLDDGSAVVGSTVIRPSGPPASVEWRVRQTDGTWRILDVVVEGVSLALTHRAEYTAVIRASGGRLDGLLERLRAQAGARAAENTQVVAGSE